MKCSIVPILNTVFQMQDKILLLHGQKQFNKMKNMMNVVFVFVFVFAQFEVGIQPPLFFSTGIALPKVLLWSRIVMRWRFVTCLDTLSISLYSPGCSLMLMHRMWLPAAGFDL